MLSEGNPAAQSRSRPCCYKSSLVTTSPSCVPCTWGHCDSFWPVVWYFLSSPCSVSLLWHQPFGSSSTHYAKYPHATCTQAPSARPEPMVIESRFSVRHALQKTESSLIVSHISMQELLTSASPRSTSIS